MVVQIDGIHITEHLVLVAAIGIDGEGVKHPLGLEGSIHPRGTRFAPSRARAVDLSPRRMVTAPTVVNEHGG
jgi:hypothetical protein